MSGERLRHDHRFAILLALHFRVVRPISLQCRGVIF
jgi:hypothetical protein